jgi:hypothetical protein
VITQVFASLGTQVTVVAEPVVGCAWAERSSPPEHAHASVPGVTDIVEMGQGEAPQSGEISYPVGPSQVARIARLVVVPAALGLASMVLAAGSMMIMYPASEIGDVAFFTRVANPDGNLLELRWSAGLRALVALVAIALAITAARLLIGRRPWVRVSASAPEADDPASLDTLEKDALAARPAVAPSHAAIVGAALLLSVLSFAFNAAAFGYAMSSHIPTQPQAPLGF